MQRVIPGVSIEVVKEVVPKPLRPSGIMGLVGIAGQGRFTPFHMDNWKGLCEEFGTAIAYTVPEARQALLNGIFELVISRVDDTLASKSSLDINDASGVKALTLAAQAKGKWGDDIGVRVEENRIAQNDEMIVQSVDITLTYKNVEENFKNLLVTDVEHRNYLPNVLKQSKLVTTTVYPGDEGSIMLPVAIEDTLSSGTDPSLSTWQEAIARLEGEADVDMVLVSMPESFYGTDSEAKINTEIRAHCENMSEEAQNRIGFGTISSTENKSFETIMDKAAILSSDHFVLVAPHGVVGAVAGRIASLPYYESPTFKNLAGVTELEVDYAPTELRKLINMNVLAVDLHRQRGFIVVKGITTSGEQISVTRVADRAVRAVKGIASLFIGRLNTEDGRQTLKQKITEFFIQMERENAIVPSVDGAEPAFMIEAYSSGRDFALGNVRVDIAVRPVRAIDYIYATIFVQV